jgi:hypothetical protein
MELYTTELSIYEIGFSQAPDAFNGEPNRRVECLWLCLNATKSWSDVFLSITPPEYVGFSALIYCAMPRCFVTMHRLATFEHAEWDQAILREHQDVSYFLEQSVKNFASVKEAAGLDIGGSEDVDSFTSMAARIRVIKMSWDSANAPAMTSVGMPYNDGLYDFPMEFSDEDWLKDLLGPWNE